MESKQQMKKGHIVKKTIDEEISDLVQFVNSKYKELTDKYKDVINVSVLKDTVFHCRPIVCNYDLLMPHHKINFINLFLRCLIKDIKYYDCWWYYFFNSAGQEIVKELHYCYKLIGDLISENLLWNSSIYPKSLNRTM